MKLLQKKTEIFFQIFIKYFGIRIGSLLAFTASLIIASLIMMTFIVMMAQLGVMLLKYLS